MTQCPCGADLSYANCCEPAHTGVRPAATAETLMRARYSAYVKKQITYLGDSLHPDHRKDWSEQDTRRWADHSEWLSLEIIATELGQENDTEGVVEFAATYKEGNQKNRHHEIGHFLKLKDQWYYVDGQTPKPVTVRNASPKIGRNDPCPCGSGKKFKKCCA